MESYIMTAFGLLLTESYETIKKIDNHSISVFIYISSRSGFKIQGGFLKIYKVFQRTWGILLPKNKTKIVYQHGSAEALLQNFVRFFKIFPKWL